MKKGAQNSNARFVEFGNSVLVDHLRPKIQRTVEMEFDDELQCAGIFRRVWLRRKINREIEKRLHNAAPPGALY